jgi:hypothetical protein
MSEADPLPSAGKSIKIGVGAPLSGNGAALGREMAQAIQLAINGRTNSTSHSAFASKRGSSMTGAKRAMVSRSLFRLPKTLR